MKIKKSYTVEFEIDTEKAQGWNDGFYDWNSYPNWNINYLGSEPRFIKGCLDELRKNFRYSGLKCKIKEIK